MQGLRRSNPFFWLTPAALVASAVPASAQVFLTEAQSLDAVFGSGVTLHRDVKELSEADRRALEDASSLRFPESSYTFFIGERKGSVVGYALVLNEIGKSEPITFTVEMSPRGEVGDVVVMVFREDRGWEVREKRFLRQFRGKTVGDAIRVNQDIVNYTGATLSSKALARGVKRALLLLDHFYPAEKRHHAPTSQLQAPAPLPSIRAVAQPGGFYRQARYLMGTLADVRVWADSPDTASRAFGAAYAELRRLDRMFSNYRADSELSYVNCKAVRAAVPVSWEFFALTRAAMRYARASGGCFDVTVGPLLTAWGFRAGEPRVPATTELRDALACVGSDKLELDGRTQTVRFRRDGMELDFGGLAKGYAAQHALRRLQGEGVTAAVVNLGGSSLAAWASAAHSEPWVVAVADPRPPHRPTLFLELRGSWTLATSGTYERGFEVDDRRLSHLLDPRTGQPLEGWRAATVVARAGQRAEALTKPLLFLRGEERRTFSRKLSRADWVTLEAASDGQLDVEHRWRRTALLAQIS